MFLVFDDGDENTLRRSKLCLKGDRHFERSEVSFTFCLVSVSLRHYITLQLAFCCILITVHKKLHVQTVQVKP